MKQKYAVYMIDKIYNSRGEETKTKTFLAYTFASSARQAIYQVRFKRGIRDRDLYRYGPGDGGRISSIVAEVVSQ